MTQYWIAEAILALSPLSLYKVDGIEEENIEWLNDEDHPSFEDILAKAEELKASFYAKEYSRLRADAYPSLKEFVEAYTEKEILGNSEKWDEYVVKYNQVRDDYTNPEDIPIP